MIHITKYIDHMRPDSLPRLWRYINLLLTYFIMQYTAFTVS